MDADRRRNRLTEQLQKILLNVLLFVYNIIVNDKVKFTLSFAINM